MTDPLRSDRPASAADNQERDRDARVEQLLLVGLDHYFAGEYELAISVWTRVLFLNHGHARARAYIERARSAIAERQRESEELLHTGTEAFGRGDIASARQLLRAAVERGGGSEEVLALLDRLDRLEAAVPAPTPSLARPDRQPAPVLDRRPLDHPARGSRKGRAAAWMVALGAAVSVAAWLWFDGAAGWLGQASAPARTAGHDLEPLPVPYASETSLARARALHARGRLHEALLALESVRRTDPWWREAQRLRGEIQRQLLAGAGAPLPGPDASLLRGGGR
jgi:tetratricopeptide (TPR) repeat protein